MPMHGMAGRRVIAASACRDRPSGRLIKTANWRAAQPTGTASGRVMDGTNWTCSPSINGTTHQGMAASFYERPFLDSPYAPPSRHHALDQEGRPLDEQPLSGRRPSKLIMPVPKSRKKQSKSKQGELTMLDANEAATADQEYNSTWVINEIRSYVEAWRSLPNPAD